MIAHWGGVCGGGGETRLVWWVLFFFLSGDDVAVPGGEGEEGEGLVEGDEEGGIESGLGWLAVCVEVC